LGLSRIIERSSYGKNARNSEHQSFPCKSLVVPAFCVAMQVRSDVPAEERVDRPQRQVNKQDRDVGYAIATMPPVVSVVHSTSYST